MSTTEFLSHLEAAILDDDQARISALAEMVRGDRLREQCCRHAADLVWRTRGGYGHQIVDASREALRRTIEQMREVRHAEA